MTASGFKTREQRVVARMEADFIAHARRKLYEGIPIPKIVKYLAYANVALNERRADLGLLTRCAGCKVPITGEPVFDPEENFLATPERWKRWHSPECRDAQLRRPRRAVA